MRPILASLLIVTLGTVNAKSIGDVHSKSKKSLLGDNEAPEGFLGRLIHKKSLIDAGNSGINPEWVGDLSLNGILGPSENEGAFSRMDSNFENMVLDEGHESDRSREILALVEAAKKQDLPWDFYLSLMAKRNGGDLGGFGYDDIMNTPRLLDRETRDDGRRYLMWRKITGK